MERIIKWTKEYKKEYAAKYYQSHKEKWQGKKRVPRTENEKLRQRERNRKQRAESRAFVDELKLRNGCIDCGYNKNPRALEFDHVRGTKVSAISTMVANRKPWEEILLEIGKCEVRCANCHKIKTWKG